MTQDKSNYKISRRENIFGADLWIVRTLARRIIALLIGLIPVKRWRFGDGEFNMCIGRHKSFQKQDTQLVTQLKSTLKSKPENLLIGINTISSTSDLAVICKKFVIRRGNKVLDLLDRTRTYDSSTITTVFPTNPIEFDNHVSLLKQIWNNRKVLFDHYEELLEQVLNYDKDWLIMITLGPTATIMATDLCTKGYQAIDLGQTPSKYHLAKYGNRYPSSHPMYNNHQ